MRSMLNIAPSAVWSGVAPRALAAGVAAAVLLAACNGSDISSTPDVNLEAGSIDAGDDLDDEVEPTPTLPDLPANIWPEEVAPVEDIPDKNIVTRSRDAVGDGEQPEGFTTVTARVTSADGEVCDVCLWLADEPDESGRGLMGVTDLGGPVGMAFVYDVPRDGAFFMFNTPTPLSIAWFSPSGEHVAQADMEPCLVEDSSICERYRPGATYTVAIEMFEGQLGQVGIGPGSSIELLDLPCV